MVLHQGIHDKMGMQRMRREGVEGAPSLVPWRGKGRSGTGVFAWCLSESVTSHAPPPWHQHTPHAEPSDETEERERGGGEQRSKRRMCHVRGHGVAVTGLTGSEADFSRTGREWDRMTRALLCLITTSCLTRARVERKGAVCEIPKNRQGGQQVGSPFLTSPAHLSSP